MNNSFEERKIFIPENDGTFKKEPDFYVKDRIHFPAKRVIIVGRAASGKTHLEDAFSDSITRNIKYTTRPKRKGEVNGLDYHFISEYTFEIMSKGNTFIKQEQFNKWRYGTSTSYWMGAKIFVFPPCIIESLSPEEIKESCIVFIDIPEDIRKKRLLKRKDADCVERRLKEDSTDFASFTKYDYRITSATFDRKKIAEVLENQLSQWKTKEIR